MMVAVTPPFPRWDLPGVRPGSTVQGWMKRTSSRSVTQQLGARLPEFPSDVAVSPAVAEVARGAGEGAQPGGGGGRSRRWLSWALKTERLGGKGRPGGTVPAPRPEPRVQTRRGTGQGRGGKEAGTGSRRRGLLAGVLSGLFPRRQAPFSVFAPLAFRAPPRFTHSPAFSSEFGRVARPATRSCDLRVPAEQHPAHS